MSDNTNKTPGQVAYGVWVTTSHTPGDRMALWNKVAVAVLAHAAPKWHPVSEPVPIAGLYWLRWSDGNVRSMNLYKDENVQWEKCEITHWQGPIDPPPFEEKP